MGERRQQAERSSETRARLVQATISLLQTKGFVGTTTALIARRAGMTTGALHHHYPTKDDLMLDVLDDATTRIRVLLDRGEAAETERLNARSLVDHLWQVYGDTAYWAVWEIIIGTRATPFHQRVAAHRRETIEAVVHPWIARWVPSAEARSEAFRIFEFMLIAIRGLSLERFLHRDPAYFEAHLSLLADLVGPGLAALADDDSGRDETPTLTTRTAQ
ncbi:MAG: TetR/AcrR family transcriptional regulator [Janthinobacterium lividum]